MNEQCPRCDSYKTQKTSKIAIFLTLLGTGSFLIWFGFIFPPIWALALLFIVISPVGFLIPKMTTCKDCRFNWKPGTCEEQKIILENKKAKSI